MRARNTLAAAFVHVELVMIADFARLPDTWSEALAGELIKPYMHRLRAFLADREAAGAEIYPPTKDRLRAFELTPLERVKVVVLGQDPYYQPGRAHGLSFSMRERPKHSLRNILEEQRRDEELRIPLATDGDLQPWAERGVLLLNAVLTVERGRPRSHVRKGWEQFTDAAIQAVARKKETVVFMLWGDDAKAKAPLIAAADPERRHLVLQTSHPSGMSKRLGFDGCGHFSEANRWLERHGRGAIDWTLSEMSDV